MSKRKTLKRTAALIAAISLLDAGAFSSYAESPILPDLSVRVSADNGISEDTAVAYDAAAPVAAAPAMDISIGSIVLYPDYYIIDSIGEAIGHEGEYIITGTSGTNTITVADEGVKLTIIDLNIDCGSSGGCPIDIQKSCELTISGENTLTGGDSSPAVRVPEGSTVVINGDGSLKAVGGCFSAGIGGGELESAGTITIAGGTVTAEGGERNAVTGTGERIGGGAGIGSGYGGNGGTVRIENCTVYAYGGLHAAGIGCGPSPTSEGVGTMSGGTISIDNSKVYAYGGYNGAGIGSGGGSTSGTIIITGGSEIEAQGGDSGAGIGGGGGGAGEIITIDESTINAQGGLNGAGIGGGAGHPSGKITITNSKIQAKGGNNDLDTGSGAGIGGGAGGAGEEITITGSEIEAVGGVYSAGIGGGSGNIGGKISISSSTINAQGGKNGAGIGGGAGGTGKDISITDNSNVTAKGGEDAAGIGGGAGWSGGTINIEDSTVDAQGGKNGAGIGGGRDGSGGDITITDSEVNAESTEFGAGIGGGKGGSGGNITIDGCTIEAATHGEDNTAEVIGHGHDYSDDDTDPSITNSIVNGEKIGFPEITADMFEFKAPSGLIYDGNPKQADITVKTEYEDTVEITAVKYYDENGKALDGAPVKAGKYTAAVVTDTDEEVTVGSFTVAKRELTIISASASDKVYDGTDSAEIGSVTIGGFVAGEENLSDKYSASGKFADKNAGANKEVIVTVTLDPETAENYVLGNNIYSAAASIEKADPYIAETPDYISVAYESGMTLADVPLPAGWTWADPEKTITLTLGTSEIECEAVFVPADTQNYNTIHATVTVHLSECRHASHTTKETPAGCSSEGKTEEICDDCGALVSRSTIPAKGHVSDGGTVTVAPTEDTEGKKEYHCTVCGELIGTETLPKLASDHTHSFSDSDEWYHDEYGHWHVCSDCGETTDTEPHIANSGIILTEPGINSAGLMEYLCTVCGAHMSYEELPPLSESVMPPPIPPTVGSEWRNPTANVSPADNTSKDEGENIEAGSGMTGSEAKSDNLAEVSAWIASAIAAAVFVSKRKRAK